MERTAEESDLVVTDADDAEASAGKTTPAGAAEPTPADAADATTERAAAAAADPADQAGEPAAAAARVAAGRTHGGERAAGSSAAPDAGPDAGADAGPAVEGAWRAGPDAGSGPGAGHGARAWADAAVRAGREVVEALGRATPPRRRTVAGALVAVLVVAGLTGADAWLRHRRAGHLAAVTAAYADADCGGALTAWQRSTQDPAFPGRRQAATPDVDRAVAACQALQDADRLRAAGDADRSFAAYLALRRTAPQSPLAREVIGPRLVAVLDGGTVTARPRLCRDLHGAVEARLLAEDDAVPPVLTACGELLVRSGSDADRATAFALVSTVREEYPTAPAASRAATVEAGLRLAAARHAAPHTATTPFHAVTAASGKASVRFVNHSPWPMTLTVKGPGGGHVVRLRACPRCGPYVRDISWAQCKGKGASTTLSLPPGRFEVALQYEDDGPDPSHGYWDLQPGAYEECYFFTR